MQTTTNTQPRSFLLPIFIIIGLSALAALQALFMTYRPEDPRISIAETLYHSGEAATTVYARNTAFNETLKIFSQLETEYHPTFGSGRLYYDIGNTYYQPGQYPWAILYYLKAKTLIPRDEMIKRNLASARQKINAVSPPDNILSKLTSPPYLSPAEYLQLFSLLTLLAVLFYSSYIWTHQRWCWKVALPLSLIAGIVLVHLTIIRYLAPIEAVMVHAAEIRKDAGTEFAKVGNQPVPAGTVVEVLGTAGDGSWVKIATQDKDFGYVTIDAVRLVR